MCLPLQPNARIWPRTLSVDLDEEVKVLDFVLWLNYYNFVLLFFFSGIFSLLIKSPCRTWRRPMRLTLFRYRVVLFCLRAGSPISYSISFPPCSLFWTSFGPQHNGPPLSLWAPTNQNSRHVYPASLATLPLVISNAPRRPSAWSGLFRHVHMVHSLLQDSPNSVFRDGFPW